VASQVIEFVDLPDSERHQLRALPVGDQALPPNAAAAVASLLARLRDGERVAIVCADQDLTVAEAGTLLGLPEPLVLVRMDSGDLPFHLDGGERRVRLREVMALKRTVDLSQAALDALAEETEALMLDHGL
jgi:hypothetical protein